MKIGLIDIEPKVVSTALMQISQHHKKLGDTVEWALPLNYDRFDKLYCSSLFDFTNKSQIPDRAICGGTGYDLTTTLPFDCDYDYSIYPACKTSYLWFSRGCKRNCPWCVVPEKEGFIRPVHPKNINPKSEYITVQDNNFFSGSNWFSAIEWLRYHGEPVDFQGIDVRTITSEQCETLKTVRLHKQIKIAWDNPKEDLKSRLEEIIKYIKPYKIMCYVLIGYYDTPDLDLYRVETLRELKIDPFVMPYNKKDPYQKQFARWVNHKAIFKTVKWKDYNQRKVLKNNL